MRNFSKKNQTSVKSSMFKIYSSHLVGVGAASAEAEAAVLPNRAMFAKQP